MSRAEVRAAVQAWFDPRAQGGNAWLAPPDQLDAVVTSFPKRINFKETARVRSSKTHAVAVVFIRRQTEGRLSIGAPVLGTLGGQHLGWKRVDYDTVLQVFTESTQRDAQDAMADVDALADALHARAVASHTFGQTEDVIWSVAEPTLLIEFGEPLINKASAVEQWFQLAFTTTQMIQA